MANSLTLLKTPAALKGLISRGNEIRKEVQYKIQKHHIPKLVPLLSGFILGFRLSYPSSFRSLCAPTYTTVIFGIFFLIEPAISCYLFCLDFSHRMLNGNLRSKDFFSKHVRNAQNTFHMTVCFISCVLLRMFVDFHIFSISTFLLSFSMFPIFLKK